MSTTLSARTIRKNYPPILTLENVRVILGISKRKASWMLQNGIIKCINNGKKTRQYTIAVDDLLEYIAKAKLNDPSVRVPSGLFTGHPTKSPSIAKLLPPDVSGSAPSDDFPLYLADEWFEYDDLLYTEDVVRITGYAKTTVNKWMAEKLLKKAIAQEGHFTTKEWLIEFYHHEGYKIQGKCRKHLLLLAKYYNESSENE